MAKAGTSAALVFGVAVASRIFHLAVFDPPFDSNFLAVADRFAAAGLSGAAPSTNFEPGYPAFLAAGRVLFGNHVLAIRLFQIGAAAAGAVLLYRLALRLTSSPRVAMLAGLMYALHPLLIRQASAASDLALTATLLVGCSLTFVGIRDRRDAAIAGLWMGVTVVTRSMTIPVLPLAAVILLVKKETSFALVLMLAACALIVPMSVRNYALTGLPWPTRSGINLYIGNSPYTDALLPEHDLDLLEVEAYERFARARPDVAPESARLDAEFDAFLTREAIAHIGTDPVGTLRQKIMNVGYQLSPRIVPFHVSGRDTRVLIGDNGAARVLDSLARPPIEVWSHAVSASVLLAGTIAGVFRRRHQLYNDAILWAVFVTFIGVNAVYVPATRYTAPTLFVMMFYTAVALSGVRKESDHGHFSS